MASCLEKIRNYFEEDMFLFYKPENEKELPGKSLSFTAITPDKNGFVNNPIFISSVVRWRGKTITLDCFCNTLISKCWPLSFHG